MESPRLRLLPLLGAALLLMLPLLGTRAQEDAELQPRALDIYSAVEDASHEKELVGIPLAPDPLGVRRGPFLCMPSSPPPPLPFPESGRGELSAKPGHSLPPKDHLEPTGSRQSLERIPGPGPSEQQEPLRLRDLRSVPGTALSSSPSTIPAVPGVPSQSVWGSGDPYN